MTLIKITPENVNEFPIGTLVLSRFGAYFPEVEGVVVDHKFMPATKFFPASAHLVVKQKDENGENILTVSQMFDADVKVGPIGTYLVKLAEKVAPKQKSPWAN